MGILGWNKGQKCLLHRLSPESAVMLHSSYVQMSYVHILLPKLKDGVILFFYRPFLHLSGSLSFGVLFEVANKLDWKCHHQGQVYSVDKHGLSTIQDFSKQIWGRGLS